jgi:tetratricopeptide (TPR) repeat protein
MNNPLMASAHRPVLEASPETPASKAALVEELQSRGRAAVGAKSWMDAKLLYEKAVTICTPDKMALFQANLSLVLRTMGEMEPARIAAQKSVDADAEYTKGWWRLGQALQALQQPKEALAALEVAKNLEPTNKALVNDSEKVQKLVEEEAKIMAELELEQAAAIAAAAAAEGTTQEPLMTNPAPTTKTTTSSSSSSQSTKSTLPKGTTITTAPTKMVTDDNDKEDTNMSSKPDADLRGYKVVNGKKTSYFHNELSEEAKNLIGDIAPKKLEPMTTEPAATAAADGTSVWNKAGTWEEKNVTKWANDALKQKVLSTTFVLPTSSPAPGALVSVSQVTVVDGSHASFAKVRGKTKYIYEYALALEWQLMHTGSDGTVDMECRGKLRIPDIDGTIEMGEGYDMEGFLVDHTSDDTIRPLLERFVQRGGFKDSLNESIDDWVRLFRETY